MVGVIKAVQRVRSVRQALSEFGNQDRDMWAPPQESSEIGPRVGVFFVRSEQIRLYAKKGKFMTVQTIDAKQLFAMCQAGGTVELIDVRTPVEFREIHAESARNVPLDRLEPRELVASRNGSSEPLYLFCRSGSRAKQAAEKFVAVGFNNAVVVEGGMLAWEQAGLPVTRGKKAISLERQVRIAAGLLVLIGAALALFIHPYFVGLSAFIGAGLLFAGITDTCGMGMLLARMPWNQVSEMPNSPKDSAASCCTR